MAGRSRGGKGWRHGWHDQDQWNGAQQWMYNNAAQEWRSGGQWNEQEWMERWDATAVAAASTHGYVNEDHTTNAQAGRQPHDQPHDQRWDTWPRDQDTLTAVAGSEVSSHSFSDDSTIAPGPTVYTTARARDGNHEDLEEDRQEWQVLDQDAESTISNTAVVGTRNYRNCSEPSQSTAVAGAGEMVLPGSDPANPILMVPSETGVFMVHNRQPSYLMVPSRQPSATGVFDLEYFRNYKTSSVILPRQLHSAALKWHRQVAEEQGLDCVIFDNWGDGNPIAAIVRDGGPSFHFEGEPVVPWKWQEMVAHMQESSVQMLVQGMQMEPGDGPVRSRGIVSCRLQQTDRYDHKRHHALGQAASVGVWMPVWDFVMVCDDGTEILIHPNYTKTQIGCRVGMPPQDHEVPYSGKGGTSGKGTFKHFQTKSYNHVLKFQGKPVLVHGGGLTSVSQPADTDLHNELRLAHGASSSTS